MCRTIIPNCTIIIMTKCIKDVTINFPLFKLRKSFLQYKNLSRAVAFLIIISIVNFILKSAYFEGNPPSWTLIEKSFTCIHLTVSFLVYNEKSNMVFLDMALVKNLVSRHWQCHVSGFSVLFIHSFIYSFLFIFSYLSLLSFIYFFFFLRSNE